MTAEFNAISPPARDYYTPLYQAAMAISSSLELEQVLPKIVESITEAMSAKASVLRLLDPDNGQLQLAATHGLSSTYLHKGPVDVGHSPIDSETLCNHLVYIEDVRTDPRFQYKEAATREGIVSALCVPLEVRGTAIGVLRVYTSEPTTFYEEDIQFISVLASLAAQAIENARLYDTIKNTYSSVVDAFWGVEVTRLS